MNPGIASHVSHPPLPQPPQKRSLFPYVIICKSGRYGIQFRPLSPSDPGYSWVSSKSSHQKGWCSQSMCIPSVNRFHPPPANPNPPRRLCSQDLPTPTNRPPHPNKTPRTSSLLPAFEPRQRRHRAQYRRRRRGGGEGAVGGGRHGGLVRLRCCCGGGCGSCGCDGGMTMVGGVVGVGFGAFDLLLLVESEACALHT